MKIPRQFLNNLATETGIDYKDLEIAYLEFLKIVRKVHPDIDAATAQRKALSRLVNEITRKKRKVAGGGTEFVGIVVGDTGAYDAMEEKKRIAKAIYKRDPERAVVEGYTDADGTPLDNRPQIMGRDNPRYRQPITWKEIMRKIVFIDEAESKVKVLILRDADATELERLAVGEKVKFRGREYKSGVYLSDGERVERIGQVDVDELLRIVRGCEGYVPLAELEDWVAKQKYRETIVTEGDVVDVGRYCILNDLDRGVKFDAEIRVTGAQLDDINRDDRILVAGEARCYDITNSEEERLHVTEIDACGVLVIERAFTAENVIDVGKKEVGGEVKENEKDVQLTEEQRVLGEEIKRVIAELDKGEGVKLVDMLPKLKASEDEVIDALDALVRAGEIFETKIGWFKVV
jgi:hypothetical protein